MTIAVYPLLFQPALHAKPWGGREMARQLGKDLPGTDPIGESWEIYWENRIANGPYAGQTLGEVIAAHPLEMTGDAESTAEFPLLVKFLDAHEWLSVQVHPDDKLAQQLEGEPRGKTECWYIVAADPDAAIAFGLSQAYTAETLRDAIETGHAKETMRYVPVQAGDFLFVEAGTMHAAGPGIVFYELQQTSDRTYRVYDWDRVGLDGKPRQLHLDKALAVTNFTADRPAKIAYQMQPLAEGVSAAELIRGQYFTLRKLQLSQPHPVATNQQAHLVTALKGHVECRVDGAAPVLLPQGTSAFVPAGAGHYQLVPDGEAEVLVGHVS